MRLSWLAILIAFPALAQNQQCGPREIMVDGLAKVHEEMPVARAIQSNGLILEIFASSSGTYTIIMSRPDGLACAVSDGHQWGLIAEKPKGRAS